MAKEDVNTLKHGSKIFGRNIVIGSVLGIVLNLQLKKIPKINFLKWNFLLRYMTRLPVFVLPQLIFYNTHMDTTTRMTDIHVKYGTR